MGRSYCSSFAPVIACLGVLKVGLSGGDKSYEFGAYCGVSCTGDTLFTNWLSKSSRGDRWMLPTWPASSCGAIGVSVALRTGCSLLAVLLATLPASPPLLPSVMLSAYFALLPCMTLSASQTLSASLT